MTDGADVKLLTLLERALDAEGVLFEYVAPKVGGFEADDGTLVEAQQKIDGGPSVLYDAVVVLASEKGAAQLSTDAATRDFIADAYAHCKFIGVASTADSLLEAAGVDPDDGVVELERDQGERLVVPRALSPPPLLAPRGDCPRDVASRWGDITVRGPRRVRGPRPLDQVVVSCGTSPSTCISKYSFFAQAPTAPSTTSRTASTDSPSQMQMPNVWSFVAA